MGISKYSKETKALCLDSGMVNYVKQLKKDIYKSEDGARLIGFLSWIENNELADCSIRMLESNYRRYVRAKQHIIDLVLSGQAVFITLTFTNKVLSETSAQTRRKYVARYLKSQSDFYVANIDFSPEKHREHYHAVVSNRCDMSLWSYGFVYCEQVRTHDFDCKRVARYVSKLTSHALKLNDISTRLLYSRSVV